MASKTRPTAARPLAMPWERRGRPALTGAWWVRALRLDERAATGWPEADDAGPAEDGDAEDGDAESDDAAAVADIRLRRWRDAFADLAADALDRQTGEYGGTPRQLRTLLAEPPERLARRVAKPAWALDVERVAASVTGGHGAKAAAALRPPTEPNTAEPDTTEADTEQANRKQANSAAGSAASPSSSSRSCTSRCAGSTPRPTTSPRQAPRTARPSGTRRAARSPAVSYASPAGCSCSN